MTLGYMKAMATLEAVVTLVSWYLGRGDIMVVVT